MEILKWLAVGVFGIIVIVAVAVTAMPALKQVGDNMVNQIENQVNELINMN